MSDGQQQGSGRGGEDNRKKNEWREERGAYERRGQQKVKGRKGTGGDERGRRRVGARQEEVRIRSGMGRGGE